MLQAMQKAGDILFIGERRQLVFHVVPHPSRLGYFTDAYAAAMAAAADSSAGVRATAINRTLTPLTTPVVSTEVIAVSPTEDFAAEWWSVEGAHSDVRVQVSAAATMSIGAHASGRPYLFHQPLHGIRRRHVSRRAQVPGVRELIAEFVLRCPGSSLRLRAMTAGTDAAAGSSAYRHHTSSNGRASTWQWSQISQPFGVFPDRASFESAVDALRAAEFRASDISAVLPDRGHTTSGISRTRSTPKRLKGSPLGPARARRWAACSAGLSALAPSLSRASDRLSHHAAGPIVAALAGAGAAGAAGGLVGGLVGALAVPEIESHASTPAASATGAACCRCIATTRNGRHARVKSLLPRAPRRLSALPKPNPIIGREALLTPFGRGEAGGVS